MPAKAPAGGRYGVRSFYDSDEHDEGMAMNVPGRRLRALRIHQGLTQWDVAELADVHPTTISKLESGATPHVHETTAEALADALYVRVCDLFDPEDITHKGKPTGTTTKQYEMTKPLRAVCPRCNLELLPCGVCGACWEETER